MRQSQAQDSIELTSGQVLGDSSRSGPIRPDPLALLYTTASSQEEQAGASSADFADASNLW